MSNIYVKNEPSCEMSDEATSLPNFLFLRKIWRMADHAFLLGGDGSKLLQHMRNIEHCSKNFICFYDNL